jgi:ABC-type multidrug transport system fused ATPase/permease subunit
LLVVFLYFLQSASSVSQNVWLAHWSSQPANSSTENLGVNLGVYSVFGILQALFVLCYSYGMVFGSLTAAVRLHGNMLSNILRSPMSFFDTTPLGRILNRFSKDIDVIDQVIPQSMSAFLMTFFSVLGTIIVISVSSPWFLIVILPLIAFYAAVQRFYVGTSRQLKRLESATRSPIYSHFQESVSGASSIRAYRKFDKFSAHSDSCVDQNLIAFYPSNSANRWLAIRLEFVGSLIILFASLFAVLQRNFPGVFGGISAGFAGLSISYSLMITQSLNWMVRMTSELETNIVAVERTKEYAETPTEAPEINPNNRPPSDWPSNGNIKFDRYSTRYRAGLDLVLKDISCDIPGGQKVGIVGRTGAGKSSLTVALFRIIEAAQGKILIDGVDISTYGLTDLRSHITIIPQDPVLFSGTLRLNIDPFNAHTDDDIWRALETSNLSEFVGGLDEGLEYPVSEGGENLSVGQRQLVCLARALLRKTKILVLDEATAAVDLETDDLIQKTIRKEFEDCTVVTIAHRLNTIMDYDRIMVLDAGRIVEFDSPNKLLSQNGGMFYSLAKDAGII